MIQIIKQEFSDRVEEINRYYYKKKKRLLPKKIWNSLFYNFTNKI